MNSQKDKPWYRNGLAFLCRQCGNCCAGPQEGYVWISRLEINALADYLKLTTAQLKEKYLRRIGLRYSLLEKPDTKDCIFLTSNPDHTGSCMVYPVRPLQCRIWPFWKENLRSNSAWRQAACKCPGIGWGTWYDYKTIEAIRTGDFSQPPPGPGVGEAALNWIKANINHHACILAVQEIYREIDQRVEAAGASCENCGRCCDFARFGHRLFATTLEMLYFLRGLLRQRLPLDGPQIMTMINDRCPYHQDQGCVIRPFRPASCRIFYCRDLDTAFQHELTEHLMPRLRRLHEQFRAVYYYADIAQWLAEFTPLIRHNPSLPRLSDEKQPI